MCARVQVSVNYWSPGTYLISWTTGDSQVGVHPTPPDAKAVKSVVMYGTQQDKLDKQVGTHLSTRPLEATAATAVCDCCTGQALLFWVQPVSVMLSAGTCKGPAVATVVGYVAFQQLPLTSHTSATVQSRHVCTGE